MVQGTECFGVFVTRNTLLIATIINAGVLFPSFIILCVGLSTVCFEYHDNYNGYEANCNARTALITAGGVSTGLCSLFLAGIIALWCKMRNAAPTTTFMTMQPYATYGTPIVSTNALQTAAHPASYAVPSMGHPHYQQHPQPIPHAALPQAPVHQASMSLAPMSQASMPQEPSAPMSQASMPQEPSAPMSQAPMPQEPLPLKQSS